MAPEAETVRARYIWATLERLATSAHVADNALANTTVREIDATANEATERDFPIDFKVAMETELPVEAERDRT